jgi:hypothetical protein
MDGGWFCRPSLDRLQYRFSDEESNEFFHGGACGDLHGYEPYIENEALGRYLITNFSLGYAFSVTLRFGYKSLIDNN